MSRRLLPFVPRRGRGKVTVLFLGGPMTGVEDKNRPAFFRAAAELEAAGYDVVNPAASPSIPAWGWEDYLRRSIGQLVTCDAMAVLPGWENSKGTLGEAYVAALTGMAVSPVANWLLQDWTTGQILPG